MVAGAGTVVSGLTYAAWRLRHLWHHLRCRLTPGARGATKGSCIDQERHERPEVPVDQMTQYVVVRADLSHGQQMAQCAHAAGEAPGPRPVPGTHVVVLHAECEEHLGELAGALRVMNVEHCEVREPLPDGTHELMALGLAPVADRSAVRRVLGALPLARERRVAHPCHNRGCPDY